MSKYVVEDEGYSRHIWRDTSQPLGEPEDDGTIKYASAEPYEVEGYMESLEAEIRTLREGRDMIEKADAQFRAGSAGYITWGYREQKYEIHAGLGEMCPHTQHPTLREALEAIAKAKEPDADVS